MRELFLLGRILVGGYFLYSGVEQFMRLEALARHVAARGIPMPELAVGVSGLLLLIGGVSLLFGIMPRVGVAALVLFLLPVTLIMHRFWAETGAARMQDTINFGKNVGLLGAILMLAAIPEPWPYSLGTRHRLFRRRLSV